MTEETDDEDVMLAFEYIKTQPLATLGSVWIAMHIFIDEMNATKDQAKQLIQEHP